MTLKEAVIIKTGIERIINKYNLNSEDAEFLRLVSDLYAECSMGLAEITEILKM